MNKTFEEIVTPRLDMMYRGALFLAAGHEDGAERLLLEAVTTAFRIHGESIPHGEADHWLESHLAKSFLNATELVELSANGREATPQGVDPVYAAAATLAPDARVAVWLVIVRRWRYEAAADAMGVPIEEISSLLGHRVAAFSAAVASMSARNPSLPRASTAE